MYTCGERKYKGSRHEILLNMDEFIFLMEAPTPESALYYFYIVKTMHDFKSDVVYDRLKNIDKYYVLKEEEPSAKDRKIRLQVSCGNKQEKYKTNFEIFFALNKGTEFRKIFTRANGIGKLPKISEANFEETVEEEFGGFNIYEHEETKVDDSKETEYNCTQMIITFRFNKETLVKKPTRDDIHEIG
jgi:hypothetical protein